MKTGRFFLFIIIPAVGLAIVVGYRIRLHNKQSAVMAQARLERQQRLTRFQQHQPRSLIMQNPGWAHQLSMSSTSTPIQNQKTTAAKQPHEK